MGFDVSGPAAMQDLRGLIDVAQRRVIQLRLTEQAHGRVQVDAEPVRTGMRDELRDSRTLLGAPCDECREPLTGLETLEFG
jgi:hypothetical protein